MRAEWAAMRSVFAKTNERREAIQVTLAAAEVCWAAPLFLALVRTTSPHPALPVWLAMLVLLLGFFYLYRALVVAELSLRIQQSLLIVVLLLSIALFFRFHVYATAGLQGIEWVLQPFRSFANLTTLMPVEWVTIMALIHLWARGIHLARRSLTASSVGFSFRSGVIVLIGFAWAIRVYAGEDISGFAVAFFFFSLVSIALARIEEVSHSPNSGRVGFSGFWIGSMVGAVALLVTLGAVVAAIFHGGGVEQVLRWLSPLLIIVQLLIVFVGVLVVGLFELIIRLLPVDWEALRLQLLNMLEGFRGLTQPQFPITPGEEGEIPAFFGTVQATVLTAIIVVMIAIVILFTWWRLHREPGAEADETRESLMSAGALRRSLLSMLRSSRDRLQQLAGLVDQFGLSARLLSAITIQRIYANLVRLATKAGYPRLQAQTPYEYLETLHEALPGSEADVAVITEAYVNAHYGQVPDDREALRQIRECWERVQARGVDRSKRPD